MIGAEMRKLGDICRESLLGDQALASSTGASSHRHQRRQFAVQRANQADRVRTLFVGLQMHGQLRRLFRHVGHLFGALFRICVRASGASSSGRICVERNVRSSARAGPSARKRSDHCAASRATWLVHAFLPRRVFVCGCAGPSDWRAISRAVPDFGKVDGDAPSSNASSISTSRCAIRAHRLLERGERRIGVFGDRQIVVANDRYIAAGAQAGGSQCMQRADRHTIGGAQHPVGGRGCASS